MSTKIIFFKKKINNDYELSLLLSLLFSHRGVDAPMCLLPIWLFWVPKEWIIGQHNR